MNWMIDNWVLMALLAAAAWALSSVIDVCFVGHGVYRKPADGPAISGLFCVLPFLATSGSIDLGGVDWATACVGMLSGIAFLLHIYYYFKVLFSLNDAVNIEIFSSLDVVIVPLLAFVFLGERLAPSNYLAIALTALGVLVLMGLQVTRLSRTIILHLATSVIAISLMMVLQAWVLERTNYATAIWLFSASAFVSTLIVFGLPRKSRRHVGNLCRQFGGIFIVVQLLEIAAVMSSQRATDKGPSVSLVALLECALPLFIMAFSVIVAIASKHWMPVQTVALRSALSLQINAAPAKLASMILIACAIFLVRE